jgi:hypothetical protein
MPPRNLLGCPRNNSLQLEVELYSAKIPSLKRYSSGVNTADNGSKDLISGGHQGCLPLVLKCSGVRSLRQFGVVLAMVGYGGLYLPVATFSYLAKRDLDWSC